MKRKVLILLVLLLPYLLMADISSNGLFADNPAAAGEYENIFTNPAAVPFKDESDAFYLSFTYSDVIDYKKVLDVSNDLILSFAGNHMAFTAGISTQLQHEDSSTDLYSSTAFRVDFGYEMWNIGVGARVSGGTRLVRRNVSVSTPFDYLVNAYLCSYETDYSTGAQYFNLGIGIMYKNEIFSIGMYGDKVLYMNTAGSVAMDWNEFISSLSGGTTLTMDRFDRHGDLRIFIPQLSLSFTGLISSSSTLNAAAGLRIQMLPSMNITLTASVTGVRDVTGSGFFSPVNNAYSVYGIEVEAGFFALTTSCQIPFDLYRGNTATYTVPISFSVRSLL